MDQYTDTQNISKRKVKTGGATHSERWLLSSNIEVLLLESSRYYLLLGC